MKKAIKHINLSLLLLLSCFAMQGQQDAQFTQYMYNTIIINPAYAGSRGVLSIFGLHRSQWVGLQGAPTTNSFSINAPINNSNLGIGVSLLNESIGPTSENQISTDISYSIPLSTKYKLSFGVKGTANLFNLDTNQLNPENIADPSLQDLNNYFSPNLGAGLYLHSDKLYLGLSVPNFFEVNRFSDNTQTITKERMNFYFIGGYVFDINPSIKFKPAFLSKVVEGAPIQIDASANFMFNDKFVLGAAYRWEAAWSALAGFQVNDRWFIGYAYDRETTNLARFNNGSHELFLRYELFAKVDKIISPRFF